MSSGITSNEMEAKRDCSKDAWGRHNTLIIYRRRIRDLFRKSFWFKCIRCEDEFRQYRP